MAGNGQVSYKLAKKSKGSKLPQFDLIKKNSTQNLIIYGGIPLTILQNTPYQMHMRKVLPPGGFIGFVLSDIDSRQDQEFLQKYREKSYRDQLRVLPSHQLEPHMQLFAYRYCAQHKKWEFVRGLVQTPITDEQVRLFLVDEMEWVTLPRNELMFAQSNIYIKGYMSTLAQLDGLEFLHLHPGFDRTVADVVKKYSEYPVEVFFTLDEIKGWYKAQVYLYDVDGNKISFNKIVLDEFLKNSLTSFPSENERRTIKGFISHADKNGTVYIHPKDSIVNTLADWMAEEADEITMKLVDPEDPHRHEVKDPVDMERSYVAPFGEGIERSYFRAKIIKQVRDKFTVRFVDYGNTATVMRDELYFTEQIHPVLSTLPPLCYPFHLKFIEEIPAIHKFLDTLGSDEYDIKIRTETVDNLRSVVLCREGRNINEDICQRGWAIPKVPTKRPSPLSSIPIGRK